MLGGYGSAALLMAVLCLWFPLAAWAGRLGVITMTEGSSALMRGASLYATAPGLALENGDVVETSGRAFVQLEFADGMIVALGPDSALYLPDRPEARRARPAGARYVLLHGWFKAESGGAPDTAGGQFWCRSIGLARVSGSVVFHVAPASQRLFVESGTATVMRTESPRQRTRVGSGQFVARPGEAPLSIATGVPADFLADMPATFRDTLPPMAARFAAAATRGTPLREVTYDDVKELLTLPRRWRSGFVRRFVPRLKDPAFRKAVDAHLAQHPEWDRVLHPEKYRSVDGGAATVGGVSRAKPLRERSSP